MQETITEKRDNKRDQYGLKASDLKRLSVREPYYWIKDLALDWTVMIAALVCVGIWTNPLTILAAIMIIGNRQHALALLGHDGTHSTISHNKKFNDFLTNYFTWIPIGLTLSGYRNLHKYHHSELGTENDPEIVYKAIRSEQWDLPKGPWQVLKLAFLDMIGNGIPDYKVILQYSKPDSSADYMKLIGCHIGVSAVLIAAGFWWAPVIWYVSLITSFIMFFRLRLWLEHHGTDTTHRLHLNTWQGALLAPHLSWHHWEHHNWPSVSYHKLPELRSLITNKEIMTLSELIAYYQECGKIAAGTALKPANREKSQSNPAFS